MKLNILHTNDIHSAYEDFSKVVTVINELKDENTIILDAGDFADFKRIELQGTDGMAALELLEAAGYDAITVGNNETFNGIDILENMATNSKIPFLSSNIYELGLKDIDGVKKSFILNKKGLRILIIGLSPSIGAFDELNGLVLKDPIEAVKEEISLNRGKYDIGIVLSHVGMDKDKEIANEVEGIHVIIGGHFHILMDEPEIVNDKIIFTSGCYAENLGLLRLEVTGDKIKLLEGKNIKAQDYEQCKEIIDVLKSNKEKATDKLSQALYQIESNLWHDLVEENPITNLLADALRDVLKCDIGIINSGVINGGIRKGKVSQKKLIELSPSPLNPTSFSIQGKYLWEALENSLDTDYCYSDGRGPGFRGKYLGSLHVSNMVIKHNDRKIIEVFVGGEKLEDEKWYTVATSDYLHRGTGYTSLKNNKDVKYNQEYLRDTLREYLAKKEFVEKALLDRWILEDD